MRVACVGGAAVDWRARLVDEPRLSTSNPARVARSIGGVACNVARTLAPLGVEVALFSRVGRDAAGEEVLASLEGVDTGGVVRTDSHPTAAYLAVVDAAGGLVIGAADLGVLEEWPEADLDRLVRTLTGFDLWVIDANLAPGLLAGLAAGAPEGVRVLADPVSVPKAPRLRPILGRLWGVFPDRSEATALTGSPDDTPVADLARRLREAGPETVVVTLGPQGCYLHEGDRRREVEPIAPDRVVDLTGCGDALLAGYVYGLATARPDPIRWGLAAASLAAETPEAVPGVDVEDLAARVGRG